MLKKGSGAGLKLGVLKLKGDIKKAFYFSKMNLPAKVRAPTPAELRCQPGSANFGTCDPIDLKTSSAAATITKIGMDRLRVKLTRMILKWENIMVITACDFSKIFFEILDIFQDFI